MEGLNNYEDSYNEICRMEKAIGDGSLTINFEKLDGETCNRLREVISTVISQRRKDVYNTIKGVN